MVQKKSFTANLDCRQFIGPPTQHNQCRRTMPYLVLGMQGQTYFDYEFDSGNYIYFDFDSGKQFDFDSKLDAVRAWGEPDAPLPRERAPRDQGVA